MARGGPPIAMKTRRRPYLVESVTSAASSTEFRMALRATQWDENRVRAGVGYLQRGVGEVVTALAMLRP